MPQPEIVWDIGTAYDLFVSLIVLHHPAEYGLRGAWAAGVRARLSVAERETLAQASSLLPCTPLHWVHALPHPKDGATALWVLRQMPPAERLPALGLSPAFPHSVRDVFHRVVARGAWDEQDIEILKAYDRTRDQESFFAGKDLTKFLEGWSRAEELGERFLQALGTFHEVFFAEEEKRIQPALQHALARAQDLSDQMALPDMLEQLSQGVRFTKLPDVAELVLAPSYWSTPVIIFGDASDERQIWLFGAKPTDASLVPGELVPDALVRSFKALSDPTRLRILRYLTEEPLTAAELSRRLRLRIPTVTHHLRTLRIAGLVQLTVKQIDGKEKDFYAPRFAAAEAAFATLRRYLGQDTP